MSKKKLHKLEALRGIAAFYVVLHHTYDVFLKTSSPYAFLFEFGQEAVILFFILSGFVIEYSFSQSKDKTFKTYFFKRFNRIYIPIIIIFIVNYLLFYWQGMIHNFDFSNLAGNLLMAQDLPYKPNIICLPFLDNSPLWSLSYEWWFYMFFFLLYIFFKERTSNAIYILGILATISYLFYPFWGNRIFMYMIVWNIGADLARVYIKHQTFKLTLLYKQIAILTICTAILVINFVLNKDTVHAAINFTSTQTIGRGVSPFLELRHFLFSLIAVIAGIVWYRLKWFGFSYTIGLFEVLAPVSYCMYVSHWFLVSKATYLSFIDNIYIRYALYFIICVAFSYLVERVLYVRINRLIVSSLKKQNSPGVVGNSGQ